MPEKAEEDVQAKGYLDYMKISQLISLQAPLSVGAGEPVHDEHLFVIMHQSKELWFLQLIKDLGAARDEIRADRFDEACMYLVRCRRIVDVLLASWEVLATLRPREFWKFRKYFGDASGLQSAQFRHIEFLLGLRHHAAHVRKIQTEQADKALKKDEDPSAGTDRTEAADTSTDADKTEAADLDTDTDKSGDKVEPPYLDLLEAELLRPSLWDEVLMALGRRYPFQIPVGLRNRKWSEPYLFPERRPGVPQSPGATEPHDHKGRLGDPEVELAWLTIFRRRDKFPRAYRLGEALFDVASTLTLWRQKHILTVQRFIGDAHGSGGTLGVPYLTGTLKWRVFPELWSVQNRFSEFEALDRADEAQERGEEDEL